MYTKPPTTFEQQLNKFQQRGLEIDDPEFDAELRNRLLVILEKIEIFLRVKISYYLAHATGSLGYRYHKNFQDKIMYLNFRRKLKRDLKERYGKDPVVTHHFDRYKGRFPIWVVVEYLSFGQLSNLYRNLNPQHQRVIANELGTSSPVLRSWFRSLVNLRNMCAHYERIYHGSFKFSPKFPKRLNYQHRNDTLFSLLTICAYLYPSRSEWERFLQSLQGTFDAYEEYIDPSVLGFPSNWYESLRKIQREMHFDR